MAAVTPPAAKPAQAWRGPLLVLGLTLLLWLGPVQLHPPIGWVDPGLYIRWFLDPARALLPGGGDYHSSRAPFVVPGSILYGALGPFLGQIALVLLFQLGAMAGIHLLLGVVVRGFALRAVLTASIALNPVWLAAIARGYVDGPAMAFGFLALAALLRAPPAGGALGAGALGMLAFLTHPLGGGLLLAGVGAALLTLALREGAFLLRIFAGVAGALGGLLLACLAAAAAGYPFLFFAPAIERTVESLAAAGSTPFNLPPRDWLPGATRVALFPAAAWLALASAWAMRGAPARTQALAVAGGTTIALHLACTLIWQGFMAQFSYYASYVWLSLVPGLALLAARCEEGKVGWTVGAAAILPAALALALVLPATLWEGDAVGWIGWALALACLGAAILAGATGRPGPALLAMLALLGIAGITTRDTASVLARSGQADFAAQHRLLVQLRDFVDRSGGTAEPYLLWIGREGLAALPGAPAASTYTLHFEGRELRLNALDSLAASLGWDAFALGFRMPETDPQLPRMLLKGKQGRETSLILLCGQAADCEGGRAALARMGVRLVQVSAETLSTPRAPRVLAQRYRLSFDPGQPEPSLAQVEAVLAPAVGAARTIEHLRCAQHGPRHVCRALLRHEDGQPEVRRVEFEPLGGLFLASPVGPATPALSFLDEAVTARLCRVEAGRIGFWLDRPDLAPSSPGAQIAFARIIAAVQRGDPLACLENAAALYRVFDLVWRPGNMPRIALGCTSELPAAQALSASLSEGLGERRTLADLAAAEAASRLGDEATCLQRTGAVRAAWLARFGLGPPSR